MGGAGDKEKKTLKEWDKQEANRQPLCIIFLEEHNFELKLELIHLLPTLRGL